MVNTKIPIPTESSTKLEKLQYEHAELYAAYKQRGEEVEELLGIIEKYQGAFGKVEHAIRSALR